MLRSHGRYDYLPITERQPYRWPNGAGLAMFTALNVEVFPFAEGMGVELAGAQPQPDVVDYSWRDYGNRVGFRRLMELLNEFEVPVSMLMNTELFAHCPQIVAAIQKRGDEFVGHGRTNAERQGTIRRKRRRRSSRRWLTRSETNREGAGRLAGALDVGKLRHARSAARGGVQVSPRLDGR